MPIWAQRARHSCNGTLISARHLDFQSQLQLLSGTKTHPSLDLDLVFFSITYMRTDCNVTKKKKKTNGAVTLKFGSTQYTLGEQLELARTLLQLPRKRHTKKQQDCVVETLSFAVSLFQDLNRIAPVASSK